MAETYHYTECGLPDVYLVGGHSYEQTARGRRVHIEDRNVLHRVIGEHLINLPRSLTGPELRYLREELALSQVNLARILGESDQSVARREKRGASEGAPTSQDRLLRLFYRETVLTPKEALRDFLKQLADADNDPQLQKLTFRHVNQGWRAAS